MVKISITGFLLFIFMIVTAVSTSQNQPAFAHDQSVWISPAPVAQTGSILDASHPQVIAYGESGGIEGNRFVIVIGLAAILWLAYGFFRYHQILEGRRGEAEAALETERKANQFGTRPARRRQQNDSVQR